MARCMQLKTQVLVLGYIGFWIWLLSFLIYAHDPKELLEIILNLCDYKPLNCSTPGYVILFFKIGLTILIASHASLIYGTIVNKYLMLLPWLISMAIFCIVTICGIVIRWTNRIDAYAKVWLTDLLRIIIIYFLLYNWYSVLIYFRQLRLKSKLQIPRKKRSLKNDDVSYITLERY